MYQQARDSGPIRIQSSGGSQSSSEPNDQELLGNQAILEGLKGQECGCGGIATGLYTTEPGEAQDSEHRYEADLDFENTWSKWIDYPQDKLAEEEQKVALYNHCFDELNAQTRTDVEGRYELTMNGLDELADTEVYGTPGGGDRSAPAWTRERETIGNSDEAEMWKPETEGDTWSGFQGDLSYTGEVYGPAKANWTQDNASLGSVFETDFDDPSGAGYGLPVKSYAEFQDEAGKKTTHVTYGFRQSPPISVAIWFDIYVKQHWCPDYKDNGKALRITGGADGKSITSSNGRSKELSGGKRPKGIEGYMQCEEWVKRDNRKPGDDRELPNGQRQADRILETKVKEAREWQKYHEDRLEYIKAMESGPARDLKP